MDTNIEIPDAPPGLVEDDIYIDIQECSYYDQFTGPIRPDDMENIPQLKKSCFPPFSVGRKIDPLPHPIEDGQIRSIGNKISGMVKKQEERTIPKSLVQMTKSYIQKKITTVIPDLQVEVFGGSVNGLSTLGGDVDCTVIVNNIEDIEVQSCKILLQNPEYLSKNAIQLADYVSTLEQQQICEQEIANALKQNEIAVMDQALVTKRDKWRKCIILAALGTAFDRQEISDFVFRARVPVIKLVLRFDKAQNQMISHAEYIEQFKANKNMVPQNIVLFSVDMCLNNLLPVQNTALIGEYCQCASIMPQMVLFLKEWLNKRDLSQKTDPSNINSYMVILLVIFYLQQTDDLPVLQATPKIKLVQNYNCAFVQSRYKSLQYSSDDLARHILGFFQFYGYIFNFDTSVVSIRTGRSQNRLEKNWFGQRGDFAPQFKEHCHYVTGYSSSCSLTEKQAQEMLPQFYNVIAHPYQVIPNMVNQNCFFCVEDPFELNVNVARTVDFQQLKLLKIEFKRAFSVLRRQAGDCVEWLLLSPKVDPPGTFPTNSFKKLKEKQKEVERGADIKVEMGTVVKSNVSFKFSLTANKTE
ncbi:DNA_polymerase sigma [Hexamita inflata]|uniref:DNA polymerase sigma n=1 Tax=Hexamita inflata TaxID=28002 RepID=A0AA86TRY4_9EUKA|nr:DNA polymerase sigma [Hexamita inflata]CAI9958951.1 DNA polymerase sigma [Hexamita inflata]